jgi:phosphatidylserine decarboxylase
MKKPRIDRSARSSGHTASRLRSLRDRLLLQEDLNFLLTNRVPRSLLTHAMGRFSSIRSPLLTRASIALWQLFTDLDLRESKEQRFNSLQDCFTRELKPGMRPVNPDPKILVSPCDGIIGAWGAVRGVQAFQAKGFPYSINDLFGSTEAAADFQDGSFITLRLTSDMYHRFHSPESGTVEKVTSISGDTWNVNPIALRRVENLFCKNERAVVRLRLADGCPIA